MILSKNVTPLKASIKPGLPGEAQRAKPGSGAGT